MTKENDIVLNQLQNPTFNAFDFKQVGLDISNTSIADKSEYKELDFVKNNPLLQTNGAFDEAKFDALYSVALDRYNQMAQNEVAEDIGHNAEFFRDNIYAPQEQRMAGDTVLYQMHRTSNPERAQKSTIRVDLKTENPLSLREIAETQRIWDEKTQSWQDSPNDSFWSNWVHTRVLAQWDEDGEHVDPITGETVAHKKGEKKINDNGTYYYENLNGRSVYGREVLSKFDTLTTDGSAWNKFDFFDSDDKKKSFVGNVVKNAVKIVPAFIPGVAPYYIGLRVGMNTISLLSTIGNLITGNSCDLFHGIEGYTKTLKTSQSDWVTGSAYQTPHAWSLESLMNIGGDVFTQLAEQRWIFKYPMAWLKGKDTVKLMESKEAQDEWVKNLAQKKFSSMTNFAGLSDVNKARVIAADASPAALISQQQLLGHIYATEQLKKKLDSVQNIGKITSMAYMTGITVQDSYGEALQEGATPTEAALLALGYAAGEYAIINSDLGKWILPELKHEQNTIRQAFHQVSREGLTDEVLKGQNIVAKNNIIKKWLGTGFKGALKDYKTVGDNLRLTARAMIGNALGEGIEETSEELLYDVSKTLFNLGASAFGSDTKLSAFDNWEMKNLFDRYALSFVGGVIGGGLGQMTQEYRNAASLQSMTKEQATDIIIQYCKEGKAGELEKVIKNTTWAPKNLTWEVADANGSYKPVGDDKSQSQNETTKKMMLQIVDSVQSLLNANGANLMDEDVLKQISGSNNPKLEMRAATLRTSKMATKMLESYNLVLSDLVKEQLTLAGINDQINGKSAPNDKAAREAAQHPDQDLLDQKAKLEASIKSKQDQLQEYLTGKKAPEFIEKALFEVTVPLVSAFKNTTFAHYAEERFHKKIEDISDADLQTARTDWEKISKLEGADLILTVFDIFKNANTLAAPVLQEYATKYFDPKSIIGQFADLTTKYMQKGVESTNDELTIAEAIGKYNVDTNEEGFDIVNDPIRVFTQGLLNGLQRGGIDVSSDQQALVDTINDLDNGTIDRATSKTRLIDLLYNQAGTGLLQRPETKQEFLNQITYADYINETVRKELKTVLMNIANGVHDDDGNLDFHEFSELQDAIDNNINRSPILEFVDSFALTTKVDSKLPISKLITSLEDSLRGVASSTGVESFSLTESNEEQINNALDIINLAKAVVNASRTDAGRFGDIFGYNATVNEITPDSHLAELDSNTADTIVQELDALGTRLKYYKTIADINSGNRLKEHDQTGVKVNTILFDNVLTHLVERDDFPPDDWDRDSITELKAALSSDDFVNLKSLRDAFISNADTMNLNVADKEAYQNEVKKFEDALAKFFKANEANIKDTDKLAKFLDVRIWGSNRLDTSILNKESTAIANQCMVWWLASIAAQDPNVFYSNYHRIFGQSEGIAPVAGQELATKIAVSAITNGGVFAKFAEAQNKALLKYIKENPDAPSTTYKGGSLDFLTNREAYYKDGTDEVDLGRVGDSNVSVDFLRTVLVTGIAGSGKSSGVARQIIQMLMLNDETKAKVLSNVWVVHTSKDKAYNFAKELFGEEVAEQIKDNCYSHSGLMQAISGTNAAGRSWNESLDAEGNTIINKDDIQLIEGHPAKYNYGVKTAITSPTLIITDEVSHLSLPSLGLVEEFAEKHGIHHLAFGDYDQSGINTTIHDLQSVDTNGNVLNTYNNYEAYAHNTNFIHAPKLGQSLRTANKIKDINNATMQKNLEALKQGLRNNVALKYIYNPTDGYLGDYLLTLPSSNAEYDMFKTTVIDLLNRTKAEDPTAKVGYIYRPSFETDADGKVKRNPDGTPEKEVDSEITKILRELNNSDEYKGMIGFKYGNAAQGDENPYYIINFEGANNDNAHIASFISDLYTGITRAKKASIILNTLNLRGFIRQDGEKLTAAPKFNISQKAIKDFTNRKKVVYQNVYGDGSGLSYNKFITPGKTLTNVTTNTTTSGEDVDPPTGALGKGTIVTDGTDKFKIIQYNKDDKDNYTVVIENIANGARQTITLDDLNKMTPVSTVAPQGSSIANPQLTRVGDIDNSNPNETQMEHHTFNMDETGLEESEDAYKLGVNFEGRYDNVLGILKLLAAKGNNLARNIINSPNTPIKKTSSEGVLVNNCITFARQLRAAGRYGTTETEIKKSINRIFNNINHHNDILADDVVIRFALKYRTNSDSDKVHAAKKDKFTQSADEKVKHLISDEQLDESEQISSQVVMMAIDADGKEIFEVPICCETNPITLAFTKGFEKDSISGQNITEWVSTQREVARKNGEASIDFIKRLQAALQNDAILGKHPQAKKLLRQIDLYLKHQKIIPYGAIQFLTTTDNNGVEQWLIPGHDWVHSGVILNTSENMSMIDKDAKFAHYEEDLISYKNLKARGTMAVSSGVFMVRQKTEITKNGHTVSIEPGKPFIIVSDAIHKFGLNPSDKVLSDALFDSTEPSTTFVYTQPQVADFAEYFKQMDHQYGTTITEDEDTGVISADAYRDKYGDIGNNNTPYYILKELLSNSEGKKWVEERLRALYPIFNPTDSSAAPTIEKGKEYMDRRASSIMDSLLKDLAAIEQVEKSAVATGTENELYVELHKSFKDLGVDFHAAPLYSMLGARWTQESNRGKSFETFLRALIFASPMSMSGTSSGVSGNGISFKNSTSAEISENINKLRGFIETNPDTKFKNGIYRHVYFYRSKSSNTASGAPDTISAGGKTLYYVASQTDRHVHLNPVTEGIKVAGTLDTGVLKTMGEQAKIYETQKEQLCNTKNDVEQINNLRSDTKAYNENNLKRFRDDTPGPVGRFKPSNPASTSVKTTLINDVLNQFKQRPESVNQYLHSSIINIIKSELEKLDESKINIYEATTAFEALHNTDSIVLVPNDYSSPTKKVWVTKDYIIDLMKRAGKDVNDVTEQGNSVIAKTDSEEFILRFEKQGNGFKFTYAEVSNNEPTESTSKVNTDSSITITDQVGLSVTLTGVDTIFDKLGTPKNIENYLKVPESSYLSAFASTMVKMLSVYHRNEWEPIIDRVLNGNSLKDLNVVQLFTLFSELSKYKDEDTLDNLQDGLETCEFIIKKNVNATTVFNAKVNMQLLSLYKEYLTQQETLTNATTDTSLDSNTACPIRDNPL